MTPGRAILRASWWGTGLFVLTAAAAVVAPDAPLEVPAFVVAIVLFVAGCLAFVAAYTRAVARSRTDLIGVADLFFLTGTTAPPPVRRALLGALAVEVVVALASAIARPYTSLAAGTLVPVYGLGLCGVWAARHGTFPPRPADEGAGGGRTRPPAGRTTPPGGRTTPPGASGTARGRSSGARGNRSRPKRKR